MLKNHFKIAFRNLFKYKSFSAINLIGLSLGLSSIMVLAFMLYQFLTVNGQFANKERMYYIRTKSKEGTIFKQTPYPLMAEALKTCPGIEAGTHIQSWEWPWLKNGAKEFQESTWYVDTAFFKVFTYPLEYGNPATALRDKYSVVLGHEMAQKLFGRENPIGKTVTAWDSLHLTVTGVLEPVPTNTTLHPFVLLSTALLTDNKDFRSNADWYNNFAENYFLLKAGADTSRINSQLNHLVSVFYHPDNRKSRLMLTPYNDFVKNEAGEIVQVIVKGEMATILFILLIMIANLINLNAATMFSRSREVAVRKMMGSSKLQIIWQFCIENGLIVFSSLFLAYLLFSSVLMPQLNTMVSTTFGSLLPHMQHDYPLVVWFIVFGVFIAILAGSYPAFHLTSLKVTDVIKGKIVNTNNKHTARNIFITTQFVLAITFIGVTFILSRQIAHMKGAALGFNKEDVLVASMELAFNDPAAAHARFDALLNDLRNNPYVKGISTSEAIPTAYQNNFNTFYDAVSNREVSMRHAYTDAGLLPTYEIPLIEGRNFQNVPQPNEDNNVLINRTAMKELGWDHAVGRRLSVRGSDKMLTVIGVMEDFHYLDLTRNIEPLIHRYVGEQQLGDAYLSIHIDPRHTAEVVRQLQDGFAAMPSRRPFSYELLDTRIDKQYTLLNGILKVTNYVSLLTTFIAAMGLFGLMALFIKQRVKEIGIRKVLGASFADIVGLLSRNFVALILIATSIAAPMIWLIMTRWLQDFAYRVQVSWWMPLAAGFVALLVALSIVLFQAVKAARVNPAKSLRTE